MPMDSLVNKAIEPEQTWFRRQRLNALTSATATLFILLMGLLVRESFEADGQRIQAVAGVYPLRV